MCYPVSGVLDGAEGTRRADSDSMYALPLDQIQVGGINTRVIDDPDFQQLMDTMAN